MPNKSGLLSVDLGPPGFVVAPGLPDVLEEWQGRHEDSTAQPWQMKVLAGRDTAGKRVGLSLHTWSHLLAPVSCIPAGLTIGQLDPAWYSIVRTRVVDLTHSNAPDRRSAIDGVEFHSRITIDDLPRESELDDLTGIAFITGFSRLLGSGAHHQAGADAVWPHLDKAAAERLAAVKHLNVLMIDAPSVDSAATVNVAHRVLLGRASRPLLIARSLMLARLLAPLFDDNKHNTAEALITLGLAPGSRLNADAAWIAPTAYVPDPESELGYAAYERLSSLLLGATSLRA